MGVLQSVPLCSRGSQRDTDQNNNDLVPTVSSNLATATTTQPLSLNHVQPQATSTPRPLSPDSNIGGLQNENYDDSLASSDAGSAKRSDSGLDHSGDDLDQRQNQFSLDDDDLHDEGVFHEDPLMDDSIPLDDEEVDEPVERPPEPTVPDEAVPASDDDRDGGDDLEDLDLNRLRKHDPLRRSHAKDPTQQAISTLFSELMGDRPIESGRR